MSRNSLILVVFFTLVALAYGITLQVGGDSAAAREWAKEAGAGIIGLTVMLFFFGPDESK
jgi:hypothetical protein